jgi:hypothetical protein
MVAYIMGIKEHGSLGQLVNVTGKRDTPPSIVLYTKAVVYQTSMRQLYVRRVWGRLNSVFAMDVGRVLMLLCMRVPIPFCGPIFFAILD